MRNILLIFLSLLPLAASAQVVAGAAMTYSVRYEKNHLFLKKDSTLNVVDYDLEWPDVVDFNSSDKLKKYISQEICGYATTDVDSLIDNIYSTYGKPVTGKFKTIPDDRHFCYVTAKARILSYMPKHFITYSIEGNVDPGSLSPFKKQGISRIITFDISRDRVFLANDMIKEAVIDQLAPSDFYERLFASVSDFDYSNMQAVVITGCWLDNGNICFTYEVSAGEHKTTYSAAMPYSDYWYVLSRDAQRMASRKPKKRDMDIVALPQTLGGDTIYNNVEQMPVFKGGKDGLVKYLSAAPKPEVMITAPSKVYISYVVDKKGDIRDVCVIRPVTPELDRHAVSLVKGMPRYTPGKKDGKPVCVRMIVPLNYR